MGVLLVAIRFADKTSIFLVECCIFFESLTEKDAYKFVDAMVENHVKALEDSTLSVNQ